VKANEASVWIADLYREHRVSDAGFDNRKAKFVGMDRFEAKRLGRWKTRILG
jgi:hypothetical protein